jgi:DNA-binding CsgD family transcriptional regulator
MSVKNIRQLVDSTADAAMATDGSGLVVACNQALAGLLGVGIEKLLGAHCGDILRGSDECGPVCSKECVVMKAVQGRNPVRNFDLQIQTAQGPKWSNVSVLVADVAGSSKPYSVHVIRVIDVRKRLEMLVRDFVSTETGMPPEQAVELLRSNRSPSRASDLTNRETLVLRKLSQGHVTDKIAADLHISRATVNNHIQHILKKLNVHTRLEAIRRAEKAGLL